MWKGRSWWIVPAVRGESSSIFSNNGALRVFGVDVDPEAVEKARSKYQTSGVEFLLGNGREIRVGESVADVFVCLETIEHVKEDRAFLEEVWRVLRPGGVLICSTPNRDITNPNTTLEHSPWNHFHVREYNEAEFAQLLKSHFEIVERHGQNPVHSLISNTSRFLAKVLGTKMAVKFNQILKCRWFLCDAGGMHDVQSSAHEMEYLCGF